LNFEENQRTTSPSDSLRRLEAIVGSWSLALNEIEKAVFFFLSFFFLESILALLA
jgi:hypothetical protein